MMQRKIAHRVFRTFAWIFGVVVFLALVTLTKVDWRDYRDMEYYDQTMSHMDTLKYKTKKGNFWLAGWSSLNVTPETPAKLLGYKPRGKYQFVQDSSFVKSLVIGNGNSTVAIVNYELMIVHPFLQEQINTAIKKENLPLDYVYFTATHTHSGIGGFIPGLVSRLALGGIDKTIVSLLADNTIESLKKALSAIDTVEIFFQKSRADTLVANRLIREDPVDPYIRQIIFEKKNGKKGSFMTFSAHPTILNSKFMGLSGDYPHYLTTLMEDGDYEFSLFAAGTVGSHRPVTNGKAPEDVMDYANALHLNLEGNIEKTTIINQNNISIARLPLNLRKAHFRVREKTRVRPWIFNALLGDTNPHFDIIQIGNVLMISSSGEISGVFMADWEAFAKERGLELIITCFNGGYIGYITPDEYYNYPLYEVRDMNWYGPYNGAYFDDIIKKLIDKAG